LNFNYFERFSAWIFKSVDDSLWYVCGLIFLEDKHLVAPDNPRVPHDDYPVLSAPTMLLK
jgi:hypothetical protein